jgi:Protein of unknown function (DUF1353)
MGTPAATTRLAGACGVRDGCQQGLFPREVTLREAGPDAPSEWVLVVPLTWRSRFDGREVRLVIDAGSAPGHGFETDLASVPAWLTWLVPRYGQYTRAAIVHDFLCQHGDDDLGDQRCDACAPGVEPLRLRDRSDADEVFKQIMRELGVPWARRWLMWSAVTWRTVGGALLASLRPRRLLPWALLLVLVGALVSVDVFAVRSGAFDPWFARLALVAASFAVLCESLMLAGCLALRRDSRIVVFSLAAGFTVLSAPLLLVGLGVWAVLALYLFIEDALSGFAVTRARRRHAKARAQRVTPRDRRRAALVEQVDAAARGR